MEYFEERTQRFFKRLLVNVLKREKDATMRATPARFDFLVHRVGQRVARRVILFIGAGVALSVGEPERGETALANMPCSFSNVPASWRLAGRS